MRTPEVTSLTDNSEALSGPESLLRSRRGMAVLLAAGMALASPCDSSARGNEGRLVGTGNQKGEVYIIDGDTLDFKNTSTNGLVRNRLATVECPESGDVCDHKPNPESCRENIPMGHQAKRLAISLLKVNRDESVTVTLTPTGKKGQFERGGRNRVVAGWLVERGDLEANLDRMEKLGVVREVRDNVMAALSEMNGDTIDYGKLVITAGVCQPYEGKTPNQNPNGEAYVAAYKNKGKARFKQASDPAKVAWDNLQRQRSAKKDKRKRQRRK